LLLACGAIAGPLFTLAWLLEGATRPDFDPLRHPISSLAISGPGWTQRATFVIVGLLMLAFDIGCGACCGPAAARGGEHSCSRRSRSA
jgi:Protein of unknown function (DUF998)